MSNYKLTIVSPVFNNLDATKLFLGNVKSYTSSNHQLIIINNNSEDGTKDYLQSKSDLRNLIVINNKQNMGFSYANNFNSMNNIFCSFRIHICPPYCVYDNDLGVFYDCDNYGGFIGLNFKHKKCNHSRG